MINLSKDEMFCPRCVGKGFVDLNDIKRLAIDLKARYSLGLCFKTYKEK